MPTAIRAPRPDELPAMLAAEEAAFGGEPSDAGPLLRLLEPERFLIALDGDAIVGTTGSFRFRLSVPGGEAAAAGVTMVGVLPTHRRRGILTAFMRRQLDDLRAAGEPLAALWASEAAIYPRFGYGLAVRQGSVEAERTRLRLRRPPAAAAAARLLGEEESAAALAPVYEQLRLQTPGMYARSETWWRTVTLRDDERARRGAGPLFRCLIELDGEPAAYALYRVRRQGPEERVLVVVEALAARPPASELLWSYLLGVDLIDRIEVLALAEDDPLFLLVEEPIRLRLRLEDSLWLRLVDLPAALAARRYAADGALVLEVADDFAPWNRGRWRLEVAGGSGRAERCEAPPELVLATDDLAAVYLGGFSASTLARAGRVEERTSGALARADAMLAWERAPFCPEVF